MPKKRSLFTISAIFLTLFILSAKAQAQIDTTFEDSLCAYTWNSDYNNCPDVLDCIYPLQWNDTTIQVPANITHISEDGLKLCLDDLEIGGEADIIYIMDLSYSMYSTNGSNVIQYPDANWEDVGDPHRIRDDALEAGFNFQRSDYPLTTAGYIGFGRDLIPNIGAPWSGYFTNNHLLPCVNVVTGQTQLDQMVIALRNDLETDGRGTNYYEPLVKALEWINDQSITPHEDQAIIFISDGDISVGDQPNTTDFQTLLSQISNAGVKIHGIYLGPSLEDDLAGIVNPTGGTLTLIPPTASADSLASVIKEIIASEIDPFEPVGMSVSNLTASDNAIAVSYVEVGDSVWQATLNKPLALRPNLNEIQLRADFTSPSGVDTTLTFKFFIDVGGEPYTNECYYCWYRTQIKVFANNVEVDTLTWANDEYTVKLYYYGKSPIDQVDIVVKTTQKGDYEVITIPNYTFDGEKYIYESTEPFAVLTGNATAGNGTTEADFEDLITFDWQHPNEIQDTAHAEVIVIAPPNNLKIYDKAGNPAGLTPYNDTVEVDTVTAGTYAELYAKVFANTKWLEDYETDVTLYQNITWGEVIDVTTGVADPTIGILPAINHYHNRFFPIKAYHTVDLTATLTVPGLGAITETIRLYIQPGEPYQLVIENTNDINLTSDLNNPVHLDPIELFSSQTDDTAYAILRDSLGNWVDPAKNALWSMDDTTVVSVNPGPNDSGFIHKGSKPSGQTVVRAVQAPLPEDTAVVITYLYDIDAIRIIRKHQGVSADITNLTMNTNEDTTLHVIGLRSDNGQWIPVPARWGIDPFATEQNPPTAANYWFFSPSRPDTGVIFAEFAGHHDTVDYVFTVGPPVEVTFEIITPDSLLIAGETFEGVVKIMNEDGLVPGIWKYPAPTGENGGVSKANYTDILSDGTNNSVNPIHSKWIPFAQTEKDSVNFNNKSLDIIQWFNSGVDTLDFVLYYAPVPEDYHQLTVKLDALVASTREFILLPGPLDTIVIKPDTLPVFTSDDPSFIIQAQGFDKFGNNLPQEIFTWNSDPTLNDFNINAISIQVFIDPSNATDTQQGFIHVTGISDTSVTNQVFLIILGPKPALLRATTRDFSGNGFLDAIELLYTKTYTIPPSYNNPAKLQYIIVEKNATENIFLQVDSLTADTSGNGTKFFLHLNEEKSIADNIPQTAWTPLLSMGFDFDTDSILKPVTKFICEDGAAPVIWTVVKDIKDIKDNTKDLVTVKLSENFYNYNGSSFMGASPQPQDVFHVWTVQNNGNVIRVDSILKNIDQFNSQDKDFTTFNMTNGQDLNASHLLNLEHVFGYVADNKGNIPNENNQKVRVRVIGNIGDIVIGPNPIIPNLDFFKKNGSDVINFIENEVIYNMIKTNGGLMIILELQGIIEAKINIMVFDAAGNLVRSMESSDTFFDDMPDWMKNKLKPIPDEPDPNDSTEIVKVPLYWDGVSTRGMKCAPGVYRLIVFVNADRIVDEISGDVIQRKLSKKYPKTVAVGRGDL